MKRIGVSAVCAILAMSTQAIAASKTVDVLGSAGKSIGKIELASGPHGTLIRVTLGAGSLTSGWHGIHLHSVGDCSDVGKFKMSKGHVNPGKTMHGLLNPEGPHPADLPNIFAFTDGSVTSELFAPGVSLGGAGANLTDKDGSAIVIHANPDDHMKQPIGGAGPRVACAVIK